MQIPVIIQARMSSIRLPGKVLRKVNGKPIIEYLISRLQKSNNLKKIIIATSTSTEDDPIVDYCRLRKIEFFRGFLYDVARRFKDVIKQYQLENFIRVCADSPLIDSDIIDTGIEIFRTGDYEIVTNVFERTFPMGQSFEIFNSDIFIKGYRYIRNKFEREHVTKYFYRNSNKFSIYNMKACGQDHSKINLSIDTEDDLRVFKKILDKIDGSFLKYSWEKIAEIYKSIVK